MRGEVLRVQHCKSAMFQPVTGLRGKRQKDGRYEGLLGCSWILDSGWMEPLRKPLHVCRRVHGLHGCHDDKDEQANHLQNRGEQ